MMKVEMMHVVFCNV